ncbi:exonuclease [Chitinophagaceae bacterium IBVUCB2]|nr:exonuclease [Chitinophagaceae bacterium IBVUCB2]
MRLITWNCQGAFRKKADFILPLRPDILVVQECEHPDKLKFTPTIPKPNDIYWYSDGGKKGIGIFSYSNYKFEILPEFNPDFRYILPFRVTGNGQNFTLLAVWAMDNKENRQRRYIGQVWFAIDHYKSLLGNSTILIGDFNSNKIWDYKDRVGSHSDVVKKLADNNIHSVYHKHFDIAQGKEEHSTLFMYRKKEKAYHIDYCFASADLLDKVEQIDIGTYENWATHSDHTPLIIKFNLRRRK